MFLYSVNVKVLNLIKSMSQYKHYIVRLRQGLFDWSYKKVNTDIHVINVLPAKTISFYCFCVVGNILCTLYTY